MALDVGRPHHANMLKKWACASGGSVAWRDEGCDYAPGSWQGRTAAALSRGPWLPLAAVLAVWLAAYSMWIWQGETVPWDSKNQFYAFFRFLARSLHDGTSPFWNPYHFGGHPSIADPQSLIFSPPFLLWASLDAAPSMQAFDFIVYGHLLIGGLAMVLYGRRHGWPASASILAATIFMFGGAAAGRLNHTGIIASYGFFPLALITLEYALDRRSKLLAIMFAVVSSCIALGRNQVALMLCMLLLAIAVRDALSAERPLAYLRRRAGLLLLIGLVGAAILTVPLLLTVQFASLSNRPSLDLPTALQASLHPSSLLSMAVPNAFGSLNMMDLGYWGPQASITPEVAATDDSFNYVFFGAVPVVLVLSLGLCCRLLTQRGFRTWALVLVLCLLFSLGRFTPVFPLVFDHVPGFAYFRRPVDGMFVVGVAMAILAGQLMSGFVRCGRPPLSRVAVAAVVISVAALVAAALRIAGLTGHARAAVVEIGWAMPVVLLVAGSLWWAQSPRRRHQAAWLLTTIAIAELLSYNVASRLNGEPVAVYRPLENIAQNEQAALDLLHVELSKSHLRGDRPRVEIIGMGGAWQNLAMVHGIEVTNGYNPLRIGIYDRMISPGEAPANWRVRSFAGAFSGYDCQLARALGLAYLVIDRPISEIEQHSRPERMETLLAGPDIWIYRFNDALPRVKFHTRFQVADADALTSNGQLRFPPGAEYAIVDDETPPTAAYWSAGGIAPAGEAILLNWQQDRVEIEVFAPSAGVLVVHDTFYPGWTATIDSRPAAIMRADTLFRGVEVPAGRHLVVMQFDPLSLENLIDAAL